MRRQTNVMTGETTTIASSPYVLDGAVILIDDGDPVPPGAVLAGPSSPPVPSVVTRRQAMLALLAAGKLDAVEAVISQAPRAVQITWEAAQDFERTNPLIEALAPQIGLTESDIDSLFSEAAKL